jgi:class 3 adenylate cyclase
MLNLKNFILRKIHQIQFRIAFTFLSLFITSTALIIFINYKESQEAITDTSLITTRQIGMEIVSNIDSLVTGFERLAAECGALITSEKDVSLQNKSLVDYMLTSLIMHQNIARIQIATIDGAFLSVGDIVLLKQKNYRFNLIKKLPDGVRYTIAEIKNFDNSSKEKREYLNTDFKIITNEENTPPSFNPKEQNWYIDIAAWPRAAWTNPYNISTNNLGISYSVPIISNNQFIGVAEVDIALENSTRHIKNSILGKNGRSFILNKDGKIILPSDVNETFTYLVSECYNQFKNDERKSFIMNKLGNEYIVDFFIFPLDVSVEWIIMTIVPLADFFSPILQSSLKAIYLALLISLLATILIYIASATIAKPIENLAIKIEKLKNLDFSTTAPLISSIYELNTLGNSLEKLKKIFSSLTKLIPKRNIEKIADTNESLKPHVTLKNLTLARAEIINFLQLTESLSTDQLSSYLNEYMKNFRESINQTEGSVNKFSANSVLTLWNEYDTTPNHAENASVSALSFTNFLKNYKGVNPFLKETTHFAIQTGSTLIGYIGTEDAMNYTPIGKSVGQLEKLETINKEFNVKIILSESTKISLPARFVTRPIDEIILPGKKIGSRIYELVGVSSGEPVACTVSQDIANYINTFTKAFDLYHEGNKEEAKKLFQTLASENPNDPVLNIYLERVK